LSTRKGTRPVEMVATDRGSSAPSDASCSGHHGKSPRPALATNANDHAIIPRFGRPLAGIAPGVAADGRGIDDGKDVAASRTTRGTVRLMTSALNQWQRRDGYIDRHNGEPAVILARAEEDLNARGASGFGVGDHGWQPSARDPAEGPDGSIEKSIFLRRDPAPSRETAGGVRSASAAGSPGGASARRTLPAGCLAA
jgi:hypothetical protein